jgi:hypothetical protein
MLTTSNSNGGDTKQQALQILWNDMILRTKQAPIYIRVDMRMCQKSGLK